MEPPVEGKPRGSRGCERARKRYDGRFMMADGQCARDGINVSAEFDGWRATAKRRSDVDDEKQGRAFSGFDKYLAESMSERMRRARYPTDPS